MSQNVNAKICFVDEIFLSPFIEFPDRAKSLEFLQVARWLPRFVVSLLSLTLD